MKSFIAQIVNIMFLMGVPPVSVVIADTGDGYSDAQCAECHRRDAPHHRSR
jgi:hypothetical protein